MGYSTYALIEYDDSAAPVPFHEGRLGVVPLFDFYKLANSKDDRLQKIMTGGRGRYPYPMRGLPETASPQTLAAFEEEGVPLESTTWLNVLEIRQSMRLNEISSSELDFPAELTISVLEKLAGWLGPGRVRLIFGTQ